MTLSPSKEITTLLEIMARLRDPVSGCPWDIKQNFQSIAKYTLEEAGEVVDAIDRNNLNDLKEELGDLLLQVVFHSQMASEQKEFNFGDVVEGITKKLIRRHPHVFAEGNAQTADDVKVIWDQIKASEKNKKEENLLDQIPSHLPSLHRAVQLQSKAADVGFDWNNVDLVLLKTDEELAELKNSLNEKNKAREIEELGDLLFVLANFARHRNIDPDEALRKANIKFIKRFNFIENELKLQGKSLNSATLDEMEALWVSAKTKLKD